MWTSQEKKDYNYITILSKRQYSCSVQRRFEAERSFPVFISIVKQHLLIMQKSKGHPILVQTCISRRIKRDNTTMQRTRELHLSSFIGKQQNCHFVASCRQVFHAISAIYIQPAGGVLAISSKEVILIFQFVYGCMIMPIALIHEEIKGHAVASQRCQRVQLVRESHSFFRKTAKKNRIDQYCGGTSQKPPE